MSSGKRNGSLVPAEFQDEAFLAKLDPVVEQLKVDVPDAKYERKGLAQLILQLRQFMENVMGKNGIAKTYPKLPASLFKDFRPDGAIAIIAARLHQFKKTRGIRQIDWNNPAMRRQVLEIVNHCRRELEKVKLIKQPVILLHSTLAPEEAARMKEAVAKMGGQLASGEEDPNITHIVYPFGPKGDPDDGKEYMRVLEFKGDKALVHWWYLPDSYDEFITRGAEMSLDPEKSPSGPWKVYVRWLTDSEKYNEWMNPVDYETEEAVEAYEQKLAAEQPAAAEPKLEAKAATPAVQTPAPVARQQSMGPPRPVLPVRSTPMGIPAPGQDGAASQQAGQQPAGPPKPAPPTVPTAAAAAAAGVAAAAAGQSPMAPVQAPKRQAPAAAVPTAAAAARDKWAGVRARGAVADFGPPAKRHKMEHEIMEVAPGSAARITPYAIQHRSVEVHRSITDGSLAIEGMSHGQLRLGDQVSYGQAPCLQPPPEVGAAAGGSTTAAGIREGVKGQQGEESTLLMPIHAAWFRWHAISKVEQDALPEFFVGSFPSKTPSVYKQYRNAFINAYRVNPSQPLTLTKAKSLVVGDCASVAKVWSFLDHWGLINFQAKPVQAPAAGQGSMAGDTSFLLKLMPPTQLESIAAISSGGKALNIQKNGHGRARATQPQVSAIKPPRIRCSTMPWVDCTALRYHCIKHPEVNLCSEAFAQGLFPAGCSSKDFVRIDHKNQASVADEDGWTPSETLLLLEGIELFGEEWAAVAEHVGEKMPSQCVQRFLSLPIEETLLDELEQGSAAPSALQAPPGAATLASSPLYPQTPKGIHIPVPALKTPIPEHQHQHPQQQQQQQQQHGQQPLQPPQAPATDSATTNSAAEGPNGVAAGTSGGTAGADGVPADPLARLAELACAGDEAACSSIEEYVLGQVEVPFADSPNPLMAQLALCSLALGPQIAGAASEAALVALDNEAKAQNAGDLAQVSLSKEANRRASAAALIAAVIRAKLMADEEETEMREQALKMVHTHLGQLDHKVQLLDDLEKAMDKESSQNEMQRSQISSKLKVLRDSQASGA